MPVEFDRVETGIYRMRWIGHVTIADLLEGNKILATEVNKDGIDAYVVILDFQQMSQIPFDVSNLRRLAISNESCKAYVVINASYAIQLINRIVSTLVSYDMHFTDTTDEAIALAQSILKKYEEEETT